MKLEDELKMSTIQNPHHRASLNIIFTGAWLGDRMNSLLKPFGISEQQYNILRILKGQKGASLNLQDISSRMIHKMSNTTRLVEKLRLKGFVERHICEENRRKVQISITPSGLKMIETVAVEISNNNADMASSMTDDEAAQLAKLLDKIRG
tara:strand:+ start:16853 stop:17305 length:453 start_codon:yes stop_codon:yes gene_type:complete